MPTLAPAQFRTHLQTNQLTRIYLIASEVTLLQRESCDLLRQRALQLGFQQRETHYVETGFSWQTFLQRTQNFSLFSEKTFIEINNPAAKFDEKATQNLLDYLAHPPEDKLLLILTEKLTAAQQKTRWYKAIESNGVCVHIRAPNKTELPVWIHQRAATLHLKLNRESVALLSDLTEGNLLATDQALTKLRLLHPNTLITPDRVLQAISDNARYTVFDLGQLILAGQLKSALRSLRGLKNTGTEATLVLWAICRELRELAQLYSQQRQGYTQQELLQKQWQQRRPLLKQALTRLSLNKVHNLLLLAENTDRAIKGLSLDDPWETLEQLTISMAK
ncbi:MAG: DNA polymerase III subunit delta [Coxiella sp. RIFCSPHIGHO2_12_FULL_42_15]|nr:MAG: DNA polymerase III subunit delta [Coxiella sp. RIFCSPHIGHO2_12_FULL_42_15]